MNKALIFSLAAAFLYSFSPAQVLVSKEPMHHNILDNSHVRLLDVHILPGDTTQLHIHATPSVFVVLDNVKTGSQVIIEEDRSASPIVRYGNIYFEGFYKQARIHRVWNLDRAEFNVMDIELPNKNFIDIDPPIRLSSFNFLFEEKPVRAYRLFISPSVDIPIPARKADILMIRLTNSPYAFQVNQKSLLKKGDFIYIPSGKEIEIKGGAGGRDEAAFFELK